LHASYPRDLIFKTRAVPAEGAKGAFLIALANCTIHANPLSADQASCHNN